MIVSVDAEERIVAIRPDREDLHTHGFACFKGLQAPEAHQAANRILHPLKRMPDGTFERIGLEQALDEIALKLKEILDRDGPEALGGYRGTGSGQNAAGCFLIDSIYGPLGVHKIFSASTIDQSAKSIAIERAGMWPPGNHGFHGSEVALVIGANPLVSFTMLDFHNTRKNVKREIAKGLKLLVIDPRRTETARLAHRFMQPMPGEDATILAGMIRLIIEKGWEDREFVGRNVAEFDELREAVEPFTPEYVARRADVPVEQFLEITQIFAQAKRGAARTGTGPNMGPHSNLTEHLVYCLNILCGRFVREGEEIGNPGVLVPRYPRPSQVVPAKRTYDQGYKSRLGDFGMIPCWVSELPTGIMADEILEPGPGQVKAFIVHGGNPAVIVPDQLKVVRAFRSLELLVTIDPYMTPTAKLSHYVLPTQLQYERPDLPCWQGETFFFPKAFTRYTPAVAKPPKEVEVAEDGYIFWGLAKRLGITMNSLGTPIDMTKPLVTDDLLAVVARNSPMSFDEIRRHEMGVYVEGERQYAEPGNPGPNDRFTVCPPDVFQELNSLAKENYLKDTIVSNGARATHRFTVRRQRHMWNSIGRELPNTKRRVPHNTAMMNPADIVEMGLSSGDSILISSETTTIEIVVEADDTIRRGIVSMTHGFGTLPEENDYKRDGVCTNLLISTKREHLQTINAMPCMSAFAVAVSPAKQRETSLIPGV
jgi:anaerobic selenocysteine-containing dehydrogenase